MILLIGGAGYIGSHINKYFYNRGFKTVVLDNLSTGLRPLVKWGNLIVADLLDKDILSSIFSKYKFDCVIHLASKAYIGESVKHPHLYYETNVSGTLVLLEIMRKYRVSNIIYASSCSVYGNTSKTPINEQTEVNPINPYAKSKVFVEEILKDFSNAYGLNYVVLRYFNVAGSDTAVEIGELHNPETHLIPSAFENILGIRKGLEVFGTKYRTNDGTCIRDYVHVEDIAYANYNAYQYLKKGGCSEIFNIGAGIGYSNLEIIKCVEKVTNSEVRITYKTERRGDPAILISDIRKANKILQWHPKHKNIEEIIYTAWEWAKKSHSSTNWKNGF